MTPPIPPPWRVPLPRPPWGGPPYLQPFGVPPYPPPWGPPLGLPPPGWPPYPYPFPPGVAPGGQNPNVVAPLVGGGCGGGGGRPYARVSSALPVPPSFFAMMPQPIGTYAEFSNSYFGSQTYATILRNEYGPYATTRRVYAPAGFDKDNWYFLTVTFEGDSKFNMQIIFYEGDPTWLTQGNVQFGDERFYGMMHLRQIGTRFCVGISVPRR